MNNNNNNDEMNSTSSPLTRLKQEVVEPAMFVTHKDITPELIAEQMNTTKKYLEENDVQDVKFRLSKDGDFLIEAYGYRLETDEEMTKRIFPLVAERKCAAVAHEAQEDDEYFRLKAKRMQLGLSM